MRRELDFKKCHYCYDRSISMTELTLVIVLVICNFGRDFKVNIHYYIISYTKILLLLAWAGTPQKKKKKKTEATLN